MTSFDDREKALENQYAREAELEFKATARRNKLLGLWAAEKLGKKGEEAEAYAKDVVMSDLDSQGENDVIDKLLKDFGRAGLTIHISEIERQITTFTPIARKQIFEGNH